MSDLISRQAVLESLKTDYSLIMFDSYGNLTFSGERIIEAIKRVPSVEPEKSQCSWYGEDGRCHFAEQEMDECDDCISRQAAIEAMEQRYCDIERVKKRPVTKGEQAIFLDMRGVVRSLPSVEPEKCGNCTSRKELKQIEKAIEKLTYARQNADEELDPEWCAALDMAIKALEKESVLNKIRAEIEALSNANPSYWHTCELVDRDDVLEIIDKYRAESEYKEIKNEN